MESLLDDMSVLPFGDTISEHDDLVGEFTGSLLEHGVMGLSHASEVGNDFPTYQHMLKKAERGLTSYPPGVGYRA